VVDRRKKLSSPSFRIYLQPFRLPSIAVRFFAYRGVIHIVGNGNIPIAIKEQELKAIARFLDSGLP